VLNRHVDYVCVECVYRILQVRGRTYWFEQSAESSVPLQLFTTASGSAVWTAASNTSVFNATVTPAGTLLTSFTVPLDAPAALYLGSAATSGYDLLLTTLQC
jgi:hypothetical protein